MKNELPWWIAGLAVVALVVFGGGKIGPLTPPVPVVVPVDPSHPLAQFRGKPGAAAVAKAHRDFAFVLKRKPIANIGTFKARLVEFHQVLYADTPEAGTLPGFSAAFDTAFIAALGIEDAALDASKADAFLLAVAAALGG